MEASDYLLRCVVSRSYMDTVYVELGDGADARAWTYCVSAAGYGSYIAVYLWRYGFCSVLRPHLPCKEAPQVRRRFRTINADTSRAAIRLRRLAGR